MRWSRRNPARAGWGTDSQAQRIAQRRVIVTGRHAPLPGGTNSPGDNPSRARARKKRALEAAKFHLIAMPSAGPTPVKSVTHPSSDGPDL
jgi:hypothetical protein